MNFGNSPHLMGPLAALVFGLKLKLSAFLLMLGIVGANTDITPQQRIDWVEKIAAGGPIVNGLTPLLLSGSADPVPFSNMLQFITTAGVNAMTLATPVAGTDDFKMIRVFSTTANAHKITTAANTIVNGSAAAGDTLTFGAHVGANCQLIAYNGLWYVLSAVNVTLSEV